MSAYCELNHLLQVIGHEYAQIRYAYQMSTESHPSIWCDGNFSA